MASYVPTRLVPLGGGRSLLYVAGQVPVRDGQLLTGRVPDEVSVEMPSVIDRQGAHALTAGYLPTSVRGLVQHVKAGRLGRKAGRGVFEYPEAAAKASAEQMTIAGQKA